MVGMHLIGVFVGLYPLHLRVRKLPLDRRKGCHIIQQFRAPVEAAQSRAAAGASARNSLPQRPALTLAPSAMQSSRSSTTLTGLCITLVGSYAAFVVLELLQRENRAVSHSSMLGRYYLLHSGLSFLLSQDSVCRRAHSGIWREHGPRWNCTSAVFVGASQVLAFTLPFFALLRYSYAPYDFWPWLNASLGLAVVVFAILACKRAASFARG